MADREIKMRTRWYEDVLELQILITHPMETGLRIDKNTKKEIRAHFIQKVVVEHNNKVVVVLDTGAGVSEDPLVAFRIKGAKPRDKIKVFWTDNMGESGTHQGDVSFP